MELQDFIHRLAMLVASFQAMTFLIGEYSDGEMRDNPVSTVADRLFWLSQIAERNAVVPKLQVVKLRGQVSVPGLYTIRIGDYGNQAFSRTLGLVGKEGKIRGTRRLCTRVTELDTLLGGGISEGDSALVAGPSGMAKSVPATQFTAAGLCRHEAGVIAIFEERPRGYAQRAANMGMNLTTPQKAGELKILHLRPLDLSADETMREILDAVKRTNAQWRVIDSLVGFEMALAPGFRADFQESLYQMISALTGTGGTVISTVEIEDGFTAFPFSHYAIWFLTDDIIAALRGDRRAAPQDSGRREEARRQSQQGYSRARDRRQGRRDRQSAAQRSRPPDERAAGARHGSGRCPRTQRR